MGMPLQTHSMSWPGPFPSALLSPNPPLPRTGVPAGHGRPPPISGRAGAEGVPGSRNQIFPWSAHASWHPAGVSCWHGPRWEGLVPPLLGRDALEFGTWRGNWQAPPGRTTPRAPSTQHPGGGTSSFLECILPASPQSMKVLERQCAGCKCLARLGTSRTVRGRPPSHP